MKNGRDARRNAEEELGGEGGRVPALLLCTVELVVWVRKRRLVAVTLILVQVIAIFMSNHQVFQQYMVRFCSKRLKTYFYISRVNNRAFISECEGLNLALGRAVTGATFPLQADRTITVSCEKKYINVGTKILTCTAGTLTGGEPTCLKPSEITALYNICEIV